MTTATNETTTKQLTRHRDVDPRSKCGGQVSTRLYSADYWCVYCGAKFATKRAKPKGYVEYGRRVLLGSHTTGWYGIPGGPMSRSTKVHAKRIGERQPICGARVADYQAWQWCSPGVVLNWVDCRRCQRSIETLIKKGARNDH